MAFIKTIEFRLSDLSFFYDWAILSRSPSTTPSTTSSTMSQTSTPSSAPTPDPIKTILNGLEKPMYQHIDVVTTTTPGVPRTPEQIRQYHQFLNIIGSSATLTENLLTEGSNRQPSVFERDYMPDNDKRQARITEFMTTEQNYVNNLTLLVELYSSPLRHYAADPRSEIIGSYECKRIFMNVEDLAETNRAMLHDLLALQSNNSYTGFGEIVRKHFSNMSCYTTFLLGIEDAQDTHMRAFQKNSAYKNFIENAKKNSRAKKQGLSDLLILPGQRMPRYILLLQEILKYTPENHPDYAGIMVAISRAQEVANMTDDYHTRLAHIMFNIQQWISDCPASIINERRSLVRHLDASEVDPVSQKVLRPVTLFLFTDRVMVARRPTSSLNGLECCGIDDLRASIGKSKKKDPKGLRFKGWASVKSTEILNGHKSQRGGFYLRVEEKSNSSRPTTSQVAVGENYFVDQPLRMYIADDPREKSEFLAQFHKAKVLTGRDDETETILFRKWNDIDMYSSLYEFKDFINANNKNNLSILYIEDQAPIVERIISKSSHNAPIIVGIVHASRGLFRFSLKSKADLELEEADDDGSIDGEEVTEKWYKPAEFERVFWDNVMACEVKYRNSYAFNYLNDRSPKRSESRPRTSKSRSRSITNITQLLRHGNSSTNSLDSGIASGLSASISNPRSSPEPSSIATTSQAGFDEDEEMARATPRGRSPTLPLSAPKNQNQNRNQSQVAALAKSLSRSGTGSVSTTSSVRTSSTWASNESTSTMLTQFSSEGNPSADAEVARVNAPPKTISKSGSVSKGAAKIMSIFKGGQDSIKAKVQEKKSSSRKSVNANSFTPPSVSAITQACSKAKAAVYETSERQTREIEDLRSQIAAFRDMVTQGSPPIRQSYPGRVASPTIPVIPSSRSRPLSSVPSRDQAWEDDQSDDDDFDHELDNRVRRALSRSKTSRPSINNFGISADGIELFDRMASAMERMQNEFEEKYFGLLKGYESLSNDVEVMKEQIDEANAEYTTLENEHDALRSDYIALQGKHAALEGAYKHSQEECDLLYEKFNDELDNVLDCSEVDPSLSKADSLEAENARLRSLLKSTMKEKRKWEQDAGRFEREIISFQQYVLIPRSDRSPLSGGHSPVSLSTASASSGSNPPSGRSSPTTFSTLSMSSGRSSPSGRISPSGWGNHSTPKSIRAEPAQRRSSPLSQSTGPQSNTRNSQRPSIKKFLSGRAVQTNV